MPSNGKKKRKSKDPKEKPPGTSVVDENTEPNDIVEALLREFMYRKGLGHILDAFDASRPRGDKTINSVKAIYIALHLQDIYKEMREVDKGVSVFEVLVAKCFKGGPSTATPPSAAGTVDVSQLEEEIGTLRKRLQESEEDKSRLENTVLNLKKKIVAQKQELDAAADTGSGPSSSQNGAVQSDSASGTSRFGLTALPGLNGQTRDPLADGAVIVGGGVLKVKGKGTAPAGDANTPRQRKSVRFIANDEWLKVDDEPNAQSAAKATQQPVKSVVYFRDMDPTTLLSPVPFHGSYYQKLESGELDKGSEEVEDAIRVGRNGPQVIKLDSSEVSKYYVGRIVDSINESGIAAVVDIESDSGDGKGRGAIYIMPLSVSGRHRCRPPPPDYCPPPVNQQAQQESKLCKYNCGFFGSSDFGGACSKCFEEAKKKVENKSVKSDLFGGDNGDATKGTADANDNGDDDSYSDDDFDDPDYDFSDF